MQLIKSQNCVPQNNWMAKLCPLENQMAKLCPAKVTWKWCLSLKIKLQNTHVLAYMHKLSQLLSTKTAFLSLFVLWLLWLLWAAVALWICENLWMGGQLNNLILSQGWWNEIWFSDCQMHLKRATFSKRLFANVSSLVCPGVTDLPAAKVIC